MNAMDVIQLCNYKLHGMVKCSIIMNIELNGLMKWVSILCQNPIIHIL